MSAEADNVPEPIPDAAPRPPWEPKPRKVGKPMNDLQRLASIRNWNRFKVKGAFGIIRCFVPVDYPQLLKLEKLVYGWIDKAWNIEKEKLAQANKEFLNQ